MSYGLHLAKIAGYPDWDQNDDRLFVQITPEMDNITKDLPCWPYFFRDEQFKGNVGELVWVICDDEFSVGYILGFANYFAYPEDKTSFLNYSIKSDFKSKLSNMQVELKMETLNFVNMKVTYWDSNSVHFVERSTGGYIIAYQTGSIFIMRPSEFYVKIANSIIKLDATGVSMVGNAVRIQSPDVELGENPQCRVLVTSGSDGSNAKVSDSVKA